MWVKLLQRVIIKLPYSLWMSMFTYALIMNRIDATLTRLLHFSRMDEKILQNSHWHLFLVKEQLDVCRGKGTYFIKISGKRKGPEGHADHDRAIVFTSCGTSPPDTSPRLPRPVSARRGTRQYHPYSTRIILPRRAIRHSTQSNTPSAICFWTGAKY